MWSHYQRTIEGIEMNTIKNALEKCRTYVAVQKFGCGHTGIGHGVEDNLLQLLNEAFEELAWLEKREPTLMSDCISAGLPLDVALKYDVQLCRLTNYVRDKALADYVKQKTDTVDRDAFLAGYEEAQADANSCCVPPQGWLCTRQSGHDGPCAVIADDKERELVSRGMSRLSEPVQEPNMKDAIIAGNEVLLNEQAWLLRECRGALDSLIKQWPNMAGLLCGSTTLGNLRAELGAYRPSGVMNGTK